jgi:hypothetical protein
MRELLDTKNSLFFSKLKLGDRRVAGCFGRGVGVRRDPTRNLAAGTDVEPA